MKRVLMAVVCLAVMAESCLCQEINWQHKDLATDGIFGVSTTKAYAELLKDKRSKKVIVAIIDSGVDTLHEDLKMIIWSDPKTGHHGWNYIESETGQEDVTKLASYKKEFYDSLAYVGVPEKDRKGYQANRKTVPALKDKISGMKTLISKLDETDRQLNHILSVIGNQNPDVKLLHEYKSNSKEEELLIKQIIDKLSFYKDFQDLRYNEVEHLRSMAEFHLEHGLSATNTEPDNALGNANVYPDVMGIGGGNPTPYHGTHVAGILGAIRINGIGLDGVADNVEIMALKMIGAVRELRDKSLARAIRYAVDHGAKIINCSFGKPYTFDKESVDAAVKYAMSKDVLFILAAGNSSQNIDRELVYPSRVYENRDTAKAWITVGASGYMDDATLAAGFSNYGETTVDVFAPGVQIYSTLPHNQYASWNGTSMAAPVVAGVAALLREYFPKLTAIQVKEIIMKTVVKRDILKDKCVSGGVVNAYNALKLAATYK